MDYIEQFWRKARPSDLAETDFMTARFAMRGYPWNPPSKLVGFNAISKLPWSCMTGKHFDMCEVYDPPEGFYLGEGCVLLDPTTVNTDAFGVERWCKKNRQWTVCPLVNAFIPGEIYRRHVFAVEDKPCNPATVVYEGRAYYVLAEFKPKGGSFLDDSLVRYVLQEVEFTNRPFIIVFRSQTKPCGA